MKRQFKHLSKTQRNQLEMLLRAKVAKRKIAEYLGVNLSTVYREIKRGAYLHRNTDWTEEIRYSADKSDYKYRQMLREKGSQIKLGNDYEYAEYLERKILEEKQSPKAVLGHIRKHNIHFNTTISVNTLYSYIRKGYFSTLEMKHLPKGNQKKKKENDKKQKAMIQNLKQIQLSPVIDTHDIETKARHAKGFLKDGDKVRVVVRFKGRQMAHPEVGEELMNRFISMCSEVGVVEKKPVMDGRNLTATLAPKK